MKSPKVIAVLLLLNLGVFAAILTYLLRAQVTLPLVSAQDETADGVVAASPLVKTSIVEKVIVQTNQLRWAQLESEDYRTFIERLRSIGCPEQTIRDIIIADLDKLIAPEIAAAYGRRKELKYWHPEEAEMQNDVNPGEVFKKQREIDKRKAEIIRELISADLSRERMRASGQEDYYERRLSFLPEERRTQVRELLEKFDEAEQKIRDKGTIEDSAMFAGDRSQLRILRQQREAEIGAVLSPQERQQYEIWLSPTANEVRHALYGMDATEQEFQVIFKARKAYEDVWGPRDPDLLDSATRQRMEEARGDMEGHIEQSLGPQRYAEFKRGQDDDFHLLSALTTRFALPREKAAEVYGYKNVVRNYREQVAADLTKNEDQRAAALKAITDETRNAVRSVLGTKAYNYYMRTGQGQWIGE